ncbi:isoquinoline 1-oxidoreductase beta subunit [Paraburkholderia caledonica]|uniref:Isoquinoline 1-oxidoreductase beta subunit n=1 Tax=Paraburkholderia caledonica TaxID=134536 RepID=A0ABU1KZ36_9BURK|nr:isoquinoline 1-oxidoreductase beta subunit [Paraburkholderia caledonica]
MKTGLSIGAAVSDGFLLGFSVPATAQGRYTAIAGDGDLTPRRGVFEPNAFIQIDTFDAITLLVPEVEMGQGIYTSIPMLIAEELEVSLHVVTIVHAPPNEKLFVDPLLRAQMTGGSTSIRYAWEPMRRAGAAARTILISAAAKIWRADAAECRAVQGHVVNSMTGSRLSYGQLVSVASQFPPPEAIVLKQPNEFKLIGTKAKRLDSPEKIDGTAKFGTDFRVPDMLYAVVVSCPVFGGKLVRVDDSNTRKIPGVRQTVSLDSSVAVVGEHKWAAKRGAAALTLGWDNGTSATYSIEKVIEELAAASQRAGVVARKTGDVAKAFDSSKTQISAVYEQPFLAHATMEPTNCTVSVRTNGCDVWVGKQVPGRAVDVAASVTGLPRNNITIHDHLLGGGFGRRLEPDFIEHALRIVKQVAAPVKVTWIREEGMQHDMYRPYYYDAISAALDSQGKPAAWKHRIVGYRPVCASHIQERPRPRRNRGSRRTLVRTTKPARGSRPARGSTHPDRIVERSRPLRSTFVVESFIDELALVAKADQVNSRRNLLRNAPRALHVVNLAAQASGWSTLLAKHRGHGISFMHAFGTFLSMAVEVTVSNEGVVSADRVVCAVDCGLAVNPDTIDAQIQGGVIFGLSAALYGGVPIKNGRVVQSNFNDYRVLRIDDIPHIEVNVVKSLEAPGGIGEPGTAALPAALTNAIFSATGERVRRLPVGNQLRKV